MFFAKAALAQSSSFTFQGQLKSNAVPASGQFELRFTLNDSSTNGIQVAGPLTNSSVDVTSGLFTTLLNFGSAVFDGNVRWLEIGVRTNGNATNEFVTLSPRQLITATPYAVRAANYSGPVSVVALTGKINDTNLSANVALLTNNAVFTRNLTASNFIGSALGLTNIPATNIIGTLPDARLSTNVAMLNATNAKFLGTISATNFFGYGGGLTNVPGRIFEVYPSGITTQSLANFGYLATNDTTPVTVILPLTANIRVGETIRVSGIGAAGWIVAQNAGQTILVANLLKNTGIAWRTNETARTWKAVAASQDGQKLAAAVSGSAIYTSANAGVTWTPGPTVASWSSIASSADGVKLVAGANPGNLYTSVNSGGSWTPHATSTAWSGVASSLDGVKLAACVSGGQIWVSTDLGVSWNPRDSARNWTSIASSGDGVNLVACVTGGQIYNSSNSGTTWTVRATTQAWSSIASSADGGTLVAAAYSGGLYVSYDYGVTWTITSAPTALTWKTVSCSADGLRMIAGVDTSGDVYVSQDSGATWLRRGNLPAASYTGVACSGDGGTMVAVATANPIYVSSQYSTTLGATGQLIGARLAAVELEHVGSGVFIPISYVGNIRAK